jgi:DNA-binding IclR family transcriptional regulator
MNEYHAARPEIPKLAAETDEVANLGVEENGLRVLVDKSEPPEGIYDNPPIGQFTNMHWTSLGKAILSTRSPGRVAEIVDAHGLPRATDRTITDLESLRAELSETRDRGYSIEDEERREGIRAVGMPIRGGSDDRTIGAISVSGPRRRIIDKQSEIVDALEHTATVIKLRHEHY